MGKEKKAIRLLHPLHQTQLLTSRPAVAPIKRIKSNVPNVVSTDDVSNVLDVSMASNNSTKSMDVSYGSNKGTLNDLPDQPTEQKPRHSGYEDAFDLFAHAELRRINLNPLKHFISLLSCLMTMFFIILARLGREN